MNYNTITTSGSGAAQCADCRKLVQVVYGLNGRSVCYDCFAAAGGFDHYYTSPLLSREPLTADEIQHLLRLAWRHGTDEDRAALRRAGYVFGKTQ